MRLEDPFTIQTEPEVAGPTPFGWLKNHGIPYKTGIPV
jgi:hypothetical protein